MTDINFSQPQQTSANPAIQQGVRAIQVLRSRLNEVLIGQQQVVDEVLTVFLAGGHVLLEGVPGTGKTLLVRSLAQTFAGEFRRIQFTPDLMPSDVTGHYRYDAQNSRFELRQGPVFTHLLLADEINRAPAKTQAALLEVMQERQVTIEGKTLPLAAPFMVLATQNPFEQEGTYHLPEAQLDRFLLNSRIDYPAEAQEKALLARLLGFDTPLANNTSAITPLLDAAALPALQKALLEVQVDERIIDYALALVRKTRAMPQFSAGAGPRAGIALLVTARARAVLQKRGYVIPEDIKALAPAVLRHRVQRSAEAEIDDISTDSLLAQLLQTVPVPRQ